MFIWLVLIAVTVALDQLSKYLTILHLKPVGTIPIIEDALHLTYAENTGMAFSLFDGEDERWVFMVVAPLAIAAIVVYMIYRTYIKKKPLPWVESLSLSLIVGGGIGNMIDRTILGYVVDMIDFRLIDFAVFNVADSFVCIGSGLMMLHLIVEMLKEGKEAPKELPEEINNGQAAMLFAEPSAASDEEEYEYAEEEEWTSRELGDTDRAESAEEPEADPVGGTEGNTPAPIEDEAHD